MEISVNGNLVTDVSGIPQSAFYTKLGRGVLPTNIYMTGVTGFTIMMWQKLMSLNYYQRVFDFQDAKTNSGIKLYYNDMGTSMTLGISNNNNWEHCFMGQQDFQVWIHFAVTYDPQTSEIFVFIDGIQEKSLNIQNIPDILTDSNFIGGSNSAPDSNVDAYFDEIKIFKQHLTGSEISEEMGRMQPFEAV